ncbi:radical SAM protein [Kitasatospora sp. NPDC101157]|uniref:radical SAM protein n=1 Tax=Kitasatospora sp. NPDC101157 TaxID=3364098 RepID=UPI00382B75DF
MTLIAPTPSPPDPTRVSDQYHMVVVQPDTFCNLDCPFCYLTLRKERHPMQPGVAAAVAADIALQNAEHQVVVLWHGSEPTAVGPARFRELVAPFEQLRAAGKLRHSIQTNATLIDSTWCELFLEYDVQVGVSIDGPKDASARVNLAGRSVHDQITAGAQRLIAAGVDTSVIAVITPETAHRGREITAYLDGFGFRQIGFNLEETEGANTERPMVTMGAARQFWRDVIGYCRSAEKAPNIRELGSLSRYLRPGNVPGRDVLPTVMFNGDIILVSPELAGVASPEHHDFVVGNIRHETIQGVLTRHHRVPYVADFERGLTMCKNDCPFWATCYGGYGSNRYCETGRFDITETQHCQGARQALVLAVLDTADPDTDHDLITTIDTLTQGALRDR